MDRTKDQGDVCGGSNGDCVTVELVAVWKDISVRPHRCNSAGQVIGIGETVTEVKHYYVCRYYDSEGMAVPTGKADGYKFQHVSWEYTV